MTIAELDYWAIRYQWSTKKREQLEKFLLNFTSVPYDRHLCRKWAEVTQESQRKGRPIQCSDAWIAATALLYKIPLVTHNVKDYAGIANIEIIST